MPRSHLTDLIAFLFFCIPVLSSTVEEEVALKRDKRSVFPWVVGETILDIQCRRGFLTVCAPDGPDACPIGYSSATNVGVCGFATLNHYLNTSNLAGTCCFKLADTSAVTTTSASSGNGTGNGTAQTILTPQIIAYPVYAQYPYAVSSGSTGTGSTGTGSTGTGSTSYGSSYSMSPSPSPSTSYGSSSYGSSATPSGTPMTPVAYGRSLQAAGRQYSSPSSPSSPSTGTSYGSSPSTGTSYGSSPAGSTSYGSSSYGSTGTGSTGTGSTGTGSTGTSGTSVVYNPNALAYPPLLQLTQIPVPNGSLFNPYPPAMNVAVYGSSTPLANALQSLLAQVVGSTLVSTTVINQLQNALILVINTPGCTTQVQSVVQSATSAVSAISGLNAAVGVTIASINSILASLNCGSTSGTTAAPGATTAATIVSSGCPVIELPNLVPQLRMYYKALQNTQVDSATLDSLAAWKTAFENAPLWSPCRVAALSALLTKIAAISGLPPALAQSTSNLQAGIAAYNTYGANGNSVQLLQTLYQLSSTNLGLDPEVFNGLGSLVAQTAGLTSIPGNNFINDSVRETTRVIAQSYQTPLTQMVLAKVINCRVSLARSFALPDQCVTLPCSCGGTPSATTPATPGTTRASYYQLPGSPSSPSSYSASPSSYGSPSPSSMTPGTSYSSSPTNPGTSYGSSPTPGTMTPSASYGGTPGTMTPSTSYGGTPGTMTPSTSYGGTSYGSSPTPGTMTPSTSYGSSSYGSTGSMGSTGTSSNIPSITVNQGATVISALNNTVNGYPPFLPIYPVLATATGTGSGVSISLPASNQSAYNYGYPSGLPQYPVLPYYVSAPGSSGGSTGGSSYSSSPGSSSYGASQMGSYGSYVTSAPMTPMPPGPTTPTPPQQTTMPPTAPPTQTPMPTVPSTMPPTTVALSTVTLTTVAPTTRVPTTMAPPMTTMMNTYGSVYVAPASSNMVAGPGGAPTGGTPMGGSTMVGGSVYGGSSYGGSSGYGGSSPTPTQPSGGYGSNPAPSPTPSQPSGGYGGSTPGGYGGSTSGGTGGSTSGGTGGSTSGGYGGSTSGGYGGSTSGNTGGSTSGGTGGMTSGGYGSSPTPSQPTPGGGYGSSPAPGGYGSNPMPAQPTPSQPTPSGGYGSSPTPGGYGSSPTPSQPTQSQPTPSGGYGSNPTPGGYGSNPMPAQPTPSQPTPSAGYGSSPTPAYGGGASGGTGGSTSGSTGGSASGGYGGSASGGYGSSPTPSQPTPGGSTPSGGYGTTGYGTSATGTRESMGGNANKIATDNMNNMGNMNNGQAMVAPPAGNNMDSAFPMTKDLDVCGIPHATQQGDIAFLIANSQKSSRANIYRSKRSSNGREARITNSMVAKDMEVCWMAAILLDGKYQSGASIVSEWFVLTAAHEIDGRDLARLRIRVGDVDVRQNSLDRDERPGCIQDVAVDKIILHPDFDRKTLANDVGLIRLRQPLNLNSPCVCKICIQDEGPQEGETCVVSGFGSTRVVDPSKTKTEEDAFALSGPNAEILRYAGIPIVANDVCSAAFKNERLAPKLKAPFGVLDDTQLCGGGISQRDACYGDGGSPLVCFNGRSFYQAGVVSYGRGCGKALMAAVYGSVTAAAPWITTEIVTGRP